MLKRSVSKDCCLFLARTAAGHRAGESEEGACHIRSGLLESHLFITEPPHPSTFTPASSSSFPPLRCLVLKSQSCPGVKYWWQAEHTRSKVHGVTCELMQLATRTTHAFCNQTDPRWPAPGTMRPGEFFERIYSAGELAQVWLRRVQRGETHFRCRRTGPAHSRRAPKLAGTCGFSCTTLSPTVPLAPGSGGGLRTCRRKPGPLPLLPVPGSAQK